MRPLLGASAMLAFLTDEPGAGHVADLLGAHGGACSAVNLAEVVDVLTRVGKVAPSAVETAVDDLIAAGLRVVPCDVAVGRSAGRIRAKAYHHRTPVLSLADCVALATARSTGADLVSSDTVLCRTARRLGVAVVPILNSAGRRPGR